jgi:hypothetical protein
MFGPTVVRRRPLLRAAAVGGTYAAGRAMGRQAQQRDYEQNAQDARIGALEQTQAEPTPPPGGSAPPMLDQLAKLTALHDQGALNDAEFAAAKAKVLGGQ